MEQYRIPNKLPSEDVNILAQRKGRLKHEAQRTRPIPKQDRRRGFKKIANIVAVTREAMRDAKRMKRNFLKTGMRLKNTNIEEGRLILIFRHRGGYICNNHIDRALHRLNVGNLKSASLQCLTAEVHALLKMVEPYVIWGYPNVTVVRELIYKYGVLRDPGLKHYKPAAELEGKKMVPLTSNKIVEEIFGYCGIICVDDLIHEIMTVGEAFHFVHRHFRSFKLRNPMNGWRCPKIKGKLRSKGGEAGFRGDEINELFQLLL
ncbi:uncharacterized protein LOC131281157 [Anopheles ziemanni]|uniref:uncharacterized protein LOC131263030 n=1 Tax=Anopheles coustani TaxID=139045 RepID=UPI002657FDB5|nr:uncharacterized protein LOC131263030 [Anopheles coustani]XP_058166400.1 uncharacterized protein LOC131281157 [Anopheles ziemanni]